MKALTILINGISISEGGSEQVMIQLTRELATLGDHQIHLVSDSSYILPDLPVTAHALPDSLVRSTPKCSEHNSSFHSSGPGMQNL